MCIIEDVCLSSAGKAQTISEWAPGTGRKAEWRGKSD